MFGRKKEPQVIDAGQQLDELQSGASTLGNQRAASAPGAKAFLLVVLLLILVVAGAFSWKAWMLRTVESEPEKAPETVSRIIPAIEPRPLPVEPKPIAPAPAPVAAAPAPAPAPATPVRYGAEEKSEADLVRERMFSSSLGAKSGAGSGTAQARSSTGAGMSSGQSGNDLSDRLEPMKLSSSKAGVLGNRDFLMNEGTMLDCILQTRMITTQPGMTRCVLTRDVYSENGKVVLLDRGTVMTGFYDTGITQGQARIFVQWSRARTPQGVTVELASPGTGSLGEAGVGGYIDTHFWERFGGSIMISMIGDLGDWATRQGSGQGDNSIQFSNTSQGVESAATEALRNSINIAPTLYKNQGERVSIFVSRDLDFSDVYAVRAK